MVNGFTVRLPAIAAIPDRVAEPGETIKGRAATAGSPSAPGDRPVNESTAVAVREVKALLDKAAPEFSPRCPPTSRPSASAASPRRPSSTIPTCCMPTAAA